MGLRSEIPLRYLRVLLELIASSSFRAKKRKYGSENTMSLIHQQSSSHILISVLWQVSSGAQPY